MLPLKKSIELEKIYGKSLRDGTISMGEGEGEGESELEMLCSAFKASGTRPNADTPYTDEHHTREEAINDFIEYVGATMSREKIHELSGKLFEMELGSQAGNCFRNPSLARNFLIYEAKLHGLEITASRDIKDLEVDKIPSVILHHYRTNLDWLRYFLKTDGAIAENLIGWICPATTTIVPPVPQHLGGFENTDEYGQIKSNLFKKIEGFNLKAPLGLKDRSQKEINLINAFEEMSNKLGNIDQAHALKQNLETLRDALADQCGVNPCSDEIVSCVEQTKVIIAHYLTTKTRITVSKNETDIKDTANAFIKDVKAYEHKLGQSRLGSEVFIAGCTLVGGLLGAVIGAVIGITTGALIGGGVGSVVPVFGTIAGAIAGGSVAGVSAAVAGLGVGAAIGGACATALLSGWSAVKISRSPTFFAQPSPKQLAVEDLSRNLRDDIDAQAAGRHKS